MEYALSLLPLLACPVMMGLMMWLMMRANNGEAMSPARTPQATATDTVSGDRLSQLRARLDELQTRPAEVAGQIERLAAEEQATHTQELPPPAMSGPQSLLIRRPAGAETDRW
ncbi:MAG: hypothetical protein M3Q29_25615 [Chloroflexota bacterium]|nr:hypothetical protein [Chloroflexota bacterium]